MNITVIRVAATIILILAATAHAIAQNNSWRNYLEQQAEAGAETASIDIMYEEFLHLENNPIDLNKATREQLERIYLLSADEVEAIVTFLEKNRPIYTVYELRNVSRLSIATVEMILPFFYAGQLSEKEQPQIRDIVRYGKNKLQLRFDKTLDQRAGYAQYSDSILERYPNRKYRGEDFYTSVKYDLSYRNNTQIGFTAEKDAGEPMFRPDHRKGFDHYGVHLVLRDRGVLKTLAVGDYRLSFGQGLILNNDFLQAKSWMAENPIRRTQAPKRHFSTAESGFFRGAATQLVFGSVSITPFYSNRKFDANLNDDDEITSLKTDGYHRTPLEIEKKRNAREQAFGTNITFAKERFRIGVSALHHKYDRLYNPTLREYNRYYLRDSANTNASIDYWFRLNRIIVAGETAAAKNGAVATLNAIHYRAASSITLTALYRHYPITYNALHAKAFAESSGVQNENGLYIGSVFQPASRISVTSYIDLSRSPWVRYNIDAPSSTIDYYLLATYTASASSTVSVRYRFERKQKNAKYPDPNTTTVLPYSTRKAQLRYTKSLPQGWTLATIADLSILSEQHFEAERGYMVSQSATFQPTPKYAAHLFAAYFDADTYDTRLYSYERNVLNTFYMPSFYGQGIRAALSAKCKIMPNLALTVKAAHTRYLNRDTIGSGTEQIDGNSRTDIYTYLQWNF